MTPAEYKKALRDTLTPKEPFKTNQEKLAESKSGFDKVNTVMGIKRKRQ